MGLSVCICARNAESTLGECLKSLVSGLSDSMADVEIIVVDHDSTDATHEIALAEGCRRDSRIRLIRSDAKGLPGARNDAWKAARYDWIGFIDADCLPDSDWVVSARAEILKRQCDLKVAAVAGATRSEIRSSGTKSLAIALGSYVGGYRSPLNSPVQTVIDLRHAPTLNVLFRKLHLVAVGGFREEFDCSGEDLDLSYRLLDLGLRILSGPSLRVTHCQGFQWRAWASKMFRYGRGRMRASWVHPKRWEWKFALPLSLVISMLAFFAMGNGALMAFYAVTLLIALIPSALSYRADGVVYLRAVLIVMLSHFAFGAGMGFEGILRVFRTSEEPLSCSQ